MVQARNLMFYEDVLFHLFFFLQHLDIRGGDTVRKMHLGNIYREVDNTYVYNWNTAFLLVVAYLYDIFKMNELSGKD